MTVEAAIERFVRLSTVQVAIDGGTSASLTLEMIAELRRLADRVEEQQLEIDSLQRAKEENETLRRIPRGEVWYWQGDGEDFPESLGCPVIMEPDVLRGMLRRIEELEGTLAAEKYEERILDELEMTLLSQAKRITSLEAALRHYADESNWLNHEDTIIYIGRVEGHLEARDALAEGESDG